MSPTFEVIESTEHVNVEPCDDPCFPELCFSHNGPLPAYRGDKAIWDFNLAENSVSYEYSGRVRLSRLRVDPSVLVALVKRMPVFAAEDAKMEAARRERKEPWPIFYERY